MLALAHNTKVSHHTPVAEELYVSAASRHSHGTSLAAGSIVDVPNPGGCVRRGFLLQRCYRRIASTSEIVVSGAAVRRSFIHRAPIAHTSI
jgi:hypothetical protein